MIFAIPQSAEENGGFLRVFGADLIVIATNGHAWFEELIIGNNVENIV